MEAAGGGEDEGVRAEWRPGRRAEVARGRGRGRDGGVNGGGARRDDGAR